MYESYPSLKERIQSAYIDLFFLIILVYLIVSVLDNIENIPFGIRISLFISVIFYEPICMVFGCTLGNYIKGIRVRRNSDSSKRINIFQSIFRYIIKILFGWLSYLTINRNPKRRAIHDIAAETVMVVFLKE